ncbi:hypothetical protein FIBSPDRAFT_738173 [Athelia psychrophila]|uniref:Uncharacterized protein n=1 Tax=Athelia psychrophila TaxID=1759441 RepID=A0A166LE87_9AGAM|nr:hypothetical protein FIBSPDRAFT_738173 [Fibularhizoctonia sp. CBS 109695]
MSVSLIACYICDSLKAHISQVVDEATFRLLAVFASLAVADEWWRAMSVSTSPHAKFIKRVAPQFYAHDATQCNLSGFFDVPEFKPIADMFRGRMLFTPLNDGLLGISIIPPQEITDHISGGWYHIRSVSDHALYWHYDTAENKIRASEGEPTQFRIGIRNGAPEKTILVGTDRITLYIGSQLYVYEELSGQLKARPGSPGDFRFRELESGNFAMSEDATVVFVDNADSNKRLVGWELSPALSPSPRETTPEHFDSENVSAH